MTLLVACTAQCNEVQLLVGAAVGSELPVVHFEVGLCSALLATPAVARQHLSALSCVLDSAWFGTPGHAAFLLQLGLEALTQCVGE